MRNKVFLKFVFIIFLFIKDQAFAFDFFATLKDAKKGDYIILTINKTYTCLSIFERTENRLILEEITYLQSKLPPQNAKIEFENLKLKASHTLLEIDLENRECLVCFDVLSHSFLDTKALDPFLLKLFQLDFRPMKKEERRKVGVLDLASNIDNRPIWNPSYHLNGQLVKGHLCEGFRAQIPSDVKFIGSKYVEIYLDPLLKNFCFPVWLQISDDAQAFKLIPIDMGQGFRSKIAKMPRPLPHFSSQLKVHLDVSFELESTYPIGSHKFFYYQTDPFQIFAARVLKKEKISTNRYQITIECPPEEKKEYGLYTTTDLDKDLIIESLQGYKLQ